MTPWMDDREIRLIDSYLNPGMTMMEWGSGGSTLYFSKKVKNYISVENNYQWYTDIKQQVPDNVELHYIQTLPRPEIYNQSEYVHYKEYVDVVDRLNTIFDVVLIDGRARRICALKILPYLKSDSIVIIHDWCMRKPYYCVLDYYDLIEKIEDTPQTIGIFKPKINWREINGYDLNVGSFDRLEN